MNNHTQSIKGKHASTVLRTTNWLTYLLTYLLTGAVSHKPSSSYLPSFSSSSPSLVVPIHLLGEHRYATTSCVNKKK